MMDILKEILRNIGRLGKPVRFLTADATEPVSNVFGLDRGKPIDRVYIEKFLMKFTPQIAGNVFEIGSKEYSVTLSSPCRLSRAYSVGLEDGVDYRIDLTDENTAPPLQADTLICLQTLNFIFRLEAAIRGLKRCLRPGGLLIGTVGGISSLSSYDERRWGHYWGFTPQSLSSLFQLSDWRDVNVSFFGNYFAAQAFLSGLAYEDLENPQWLDRVDSRYPVIIGFSAIRI